MEGWGGYILPVFFLDKLNGFNLIGLGFYGSVLFYGDGVGQGEEEE